MKNTVIYSIVLSSFCMASAHAGDVGILYGSAEYKDFSCDGAVSNDICENTVDSARLYIRQGINENFSMEYGLMYFDSMQWVFFSQPYAVLFKTAGITVDAVGILPVADDFSINARIGGYFGDASADIQQSMNFTSESQTALTFRYGVGAEYQISSFVLGLEYAVTNISSGNSETDAEYTGVTLAYRF